MFYIETLSSVFLKLWTNLWPKYRESLREHSFAIRVLDAISLIKEISHCIKIPTNFKYVVIFTKPLQSSD